MRAVISDVPGTSWRLIAKVDVDEVEGPERLLRWVIGALAMVMLAASAFGVRLVWRASEARLALTAERAERSSRGLIETAVDGALRVDGHGRILDVNRSLCEMTGYSRAELLSMTLADVEDNLTPEAIASALARIKATGRMRFTTRWKRRDGTLIEFDATTSYTETDGEDVFFGFVRDLTDELRRNRQLERLNLFYRFMRDIEVGLREAREPAGMLRVYTETAVARAGPVLAWGGVLDPLSGEVDILAAAGTAAECARGLRITNDALRPEGQGPSGRALREGRTQVVNDFQSNGMTGPWHEQARRFDIRSNVSVPILVEGKVVGVIAVYAREPNFFDEAMVELVDESVRTLALAWAAAHHVQERDAERERRLASEDRYQRIFEFSWMPMQLHSLPDMDLVAVNSA